MPRRRRHQAQPAPATKRSTRHDGWINGASGHGTSRDRRGLTRFGCRIVTDLEAVHRWRGNWLTAKIVEALPFDAFRRGFTLNLPEGDGGKELAEEIVAHTEDLDLLGKLMLAAQYERAYGGAAIMPVLSGAVGELHEPLNADGIVSVDALHVLEPRELHVESWYEDVRSPKWRQPQTYRIMPLAPMRGQGMHWVEIHESRLVIFPGVKVSTEVLAGQRQGWGDSVLSRVDEVLADDGLSWGSVATILQEFAQGILKLDGLAEILSDKKDGEALMNRRMAALDMQRSTLRSMVLDAKDDFSRATTPLSGLPETLVQLAQRVAAAADMPVTVLLGMSPAGMNATGESDIRLWYDRVAGVRLLRYHRQTEALLRLIMLSSSGPTGGEEPKVWSIKWLPLWEPSSKELADERKVVAETDKLYVDMGSASPEDVARSRWGGDTYSSEMTIDWEARKRQQQLDEERQEELDAAALEAMGRLPSESAEGGELDAPTGQQEEAPDTESGDED